MERKPVTSSNIKSVGYNEVKRILEIEFNNGSIYEYSSVPKEVYDSLINASSKGKYFNVSIKKGFAYRRVM